MFTDALLIAVLDAATGELDACPSDDQVIAAKDTVFCVARSQGALHNMTEACSD